MPDGIGTTAVFAEFAIVQTTVRVVTPDGDVFAPGSRAMVIDANPASGTYWIDFGEPISAVVSVDASQIAPG